MSEHVKQLRTIVAALESAFRAGGAIEKALRAAADELERLQAENEALRATLRLGTETVKLAAELRGERE